MSLILRVCAILQFVVFAATWLISIPILLVFGFSGPMFFSTPDTPVASEAWQRGFEYAECVWLVGLPVCAIACLCRWLRQLA